MTAAFTDITAAIPLGPPQPPPSDERTVLIPDGLTKPQQQHQDVKTTERTNCGLSQKGRRCCICGCTFSTFMICLLGTLRIILRVYSIEEKSKRQQHKIEQLRKYKIEDFALNSFRNSIPRVGRSLQSSDVASSLLLTAMTTTKQIERPSNDNSSIDDDNTYGEFFKQLVTDKILTDDEHFTDDDDNGDLSINKILAQQIRMKFRQALTAREFRADEKEVRQRKTIMKV